MTSLATHPTKLGVWGPQSYNHAKTYLGMPDKHLSIVGPAQFDIYRNGQTKSEKPTKESTENKTKTTDKKEKSNK